MIQFKPDGFSFLLKSATKSPTNSEDTEAREKAGGKGWLGDIREVSRQEEINL